MNATFKLRISTPMEPEEVTTKSWLVVPSLIPDSLTRWLTRLDLRLSTFPLDKSLLFLTLLKSINLKVTNSLSLLDKSMVLVLPEIGLLSKPIRIIVLIECFLTFLCYLLSRGPYLQGIKAVVAQSYERIHRSNLVGMGILPTEFLNGQNADSLGLNGTETFNIDLRGGNLKVNEVLNVTTSNGKSFQVKIRLDTDVEIAYYQNGGIL